MIKKTQFSIKGMNKMYARKIKLSTRKKKSLCDTNGTSFPNQTTTTLLLRLHFRLRCFFRQYVSFAFGTLILSTNDSLYFSLHFLLRDGG
jgi:hypothetical protein